MTKVTPYFALLFMGILLAACGDSKPAPTVEEAETGITGTYVIDTDQSVIIWKGAMLGIKFHEGTMQLLQGQLNLEDGVVIGGSLTADVNSMTPTDENYQPEEGATREKLVGHLKSDDFFNTDEFPTSTFVITEGMGNSAKGRLTVRGNTNEEQIFNISVEDNGESIRASGSLTFNRKNYDVAWDSPMKDVVLSNDIELNISLVAKKS
jgi:polyisoprenoid-binding protein YceI